MKARKLIIWTLLSILLLSTSACGGDGEEEGVKELKMGVGLPMTGLYGTVVGVPAKYAWELAAEDIGEFTVSGEQYCWDLIIEDNLATTAGGTASTTKFIFEDDVDFMHQATASPGLAAEPICQEKEIILDIAGANPEHFSPDKPQLFQIAATWAINIPPFFDWLSQEHPEVKRIAYSAPDDDTGYAIADAIDTCAAYHGLEVVAGEFTPTTTTEYYPVATRIMAKEPDLFLDTGVGFVTQVLWEMGYEGLAASWYWLRSQAEWVGWDKCQGVLIFMPIPLGGLWPEAEAMAAEYEARHGAELNPAAFWALNVMYVITDVLRQAGTVDDMDIIIATMETGAFDSLMGHIYYGGEALNGIGHLAVWPSPIYEVVGEDEYRVIDVYTPEETEAILAEVYK